MGPQYIEADPHSHLPNVRILAGIVDRHNLVVVNGLSDKCEGLITRKRVTVDKTEKSIIDHVIISDDLKSLLVSLNIDEDRKHVLEKVTKTKLGIVRTKSDHNVLITRFGIEN